MVWSISEKIGRKGPFTERSPGSADRDSFDAQGGLTDADGHALAVLSAGADASIEFEIVTDHADAVKIGGTIADQHGPFDRGADLAVFDPIRLSALEDVLA